MNRSRYLSNKSGLVWAVAVACLGLGMAGCVEVPDFGGLLQTDAEAAITAATLTVGNITEGYSESIEAGRVMGQNPVAGTEVLSESPVDLVVSKGVAAKQPLAQYSFPVNSGDERYYMTMQGDAGIFGGGPSYAITQSAGALHIATQTVGTASSFGGFWHSTNEKCINTDLVLDPSAPLPWPIKAAWQPRIVGMYVVAKGAGDWRVEWKEKAADGEETLIGAHSFDAFSTTAYTEYQWELDASTPPFKLVNIVVETNSDIWVDEIGFMVEMPEGLSPLRYSMLVSLGQLLRCYDSDTGYCRDHSNWPIREEVANPTLEESRSFNAVPALGFTALAVASGADLGFVSTADAKVIVQKTTANLLSTPAHSSGFLPHWTRLHIDGTVDAHPESEYSTVDTALAYLCSYTAAAMLGMDSECSAILTAVRALDFDAITINNQLSHGFTPEGTLIEYTWQEFGGETTCLMLLAKLNDLGNQFDYAHEPPCFRRNGFIAEMAALVFPRFGGDGSYGADGYGIDWYTMRQELLAAQKAVLNAPNMLGGHSSCEIISAGGYHAYLVSGADSDDIEAFPSEEGAAEDFGTLANWVAPHYRLMTASFEPAVTSSDVEALREKGVMRPLCGPAESVLWDTSDWSIARWHSKQVAINAFFSALGAYHGVVADEGLVDAVFDAVTRDSVLNVAEEAVFTEGGLPKDVTLQGEDGQALSGTTLVTHWRSNADELMTVYLLDGEGIYLDITLAANATCTAVVTYSNDNYGSSEEVSVAFVNEEDDTETAMGSFVVEDTGWGGGGWDVFKESESLGPGELTPGTYELHIRCLAGTGDGYGIEIDRIQLDFETQ